MLHALKKISILSIILNLFFFSFKQGKKKSSLTRIPLVSHAVCFRSFLLEQVETQYVETRHNKAVMLMFFCDIPEVNFSLPIRECYSLTGTNPQ